MLIAFFVRCLFVHMLDDIYIWVFTYFLIFMLLIRLKLTANECLLSVVNCQL